MKEIILATRNRGKTKEIQSLFCDLPIRLLSLLDFEAIPDVLEDGKTLEENALKKAREIFRQTNIPSLADDSGLEVFALDMRPGVFSARYAGDDATYDDNNRKLLAELEGLPLDRRTARFRCVAAFVADDIERLTQGVCSGVIITECKGSGGFGYDPLFVPNGYDKTFAELPLGKKNLISHRSKALHEMRKFLIPLL